MNDAMFDVSENDQPTEYWIHLYGPRVLVGFIPMPNGSQGAVA